MVKEQKRKALVTGYQECAARERAARPPAPAKVPRVDEGPAMPAHFVHTDPDDWRESRRLLREWGADDAMVERLTWQCLRPPTSEQIAHVIQVADRYAAAHGGRLTNPTGFFLKALRGAWE